MAASLRTAIDDAHASAVPASSVRPNGGVVVALGRIEMKQLVRHPAFWLSIVFALLLFRGAIGASDETGLTLNLAWLVGGIAIGSLIASVLTSNIAALRARRDGLGELFGSLPSPPEARTAGVLFGITFGLGGLAAMVGGVAWVVFERLDDLREASDLFLFAQYVLAIIALGAAGVAIGRWIPSVLGGPLFVIAHVFTGLVWVVPWVAITSSGIDVAWHLTYLVAMIASLAALAFARDRRTVSRFVVAAAVLGLAVFAAVQQTPPGGY